MKTLKVGMDISQTAYKGGVANYTTNLAEELSQSSSLSMSFLYSSLTKKYNGNLSNVKSYRFSNKMQQLIFNRLRIFPVELFLGDIEVFHSSDWTQPNTRAKKVTTYHDVIPLKYPEWSHPYIVDVHKRRLKIVEKEIDMIIAVSNSTKKDLLEISNIPAEKIVVIYEGGIETKSFSPNEIDQFRKKYNLPEKFILSIGGIGERKNISRIKQATKDYNLIITGESLPYLPDEEMPLLYACSHLLLYPSLYEGFGLPVLQALKSGVPVITSYNSSLPEVGGDAVRYVDPFRINDIRSVLREVYNDKNLRKEMIARGFKQAKKFSWKKCADETAQVYKKIIKN